MDELLVRMRSRFAKVLPLMSSRVLLPGLVMTEEAFDIMAQSNGDTAGILVSMSFEEKTPLSSAAQIARRKKLLFATPSDLVSFAMGSPEFFFNAHDLLTMVPSGIREKHTRAWRALIVSEWQEHPMSRFRDFVHGEARLLLQALPAEAVVLSASSHILVARRG